ncbi:MAG: hypothetical protein K2L70_07050 [Clostridia bacterium]|nr:hypothetical protein [Clostridia bacterium]
MKKKFVFIITIALAICVFTFSFAGCRYDDRNSLKLKQVYQLPDSNIVFEIGGVWAIDWLEYTVDDGNTWQKAEHRSILGEYYHYEISESDYGKEFKIAVRNGFREKTKSNTISYVVKAPVDFWEDNLCGVWDEDKRIYKDEYRFVFEDGKIQLKKYYLQQNGAAVLNDVEQKDKLNFEYKMIEKSSAVEQNVDKLEKLDFLRDLFPNEDEYLQALELVAVWSSYLDKLDELYDMEGWIDYDYSKGILEEEYLDHTVVHFSEGDDDIVLSGKQVFMLVRIKESSTTLRSETFLIIVPLQ